MMTLEKAGKLLGMTAKESNDNLRPFSEDDPFNDDSLVGGWISRAADHRYGAMVIAFVDGRPVTPQVIHCTPKIPYPFDRNGVYHFPTADRIVVLDKLDGTNIFAFTYKALGKKRRVSYKTRLMPFVGNRSQGRFLELWQQILKRYPAIPATVLESKLGISFEMYGYRNAHTILYNTALDVAMLFAVEPATGKLFPPEPEWENEGFASRCVIGIVGVPSMAPTPAVESDIKNPHDLVSYYRRMEEQKQAGLRRAEDDDTFTGSEGCVWWFKTADGWKPFKCKPDDIKAIHFAVGGPSRVAIRHAAFRAQESTTMLTVDDIAEQLLEDFPHDKVMKRMAAIEKVVREINAEAALKTKVLDIYHDLRDAEPFDFGLKINKRETMREMAKWFPKDKMHKVYAFIAIEEGVFTR